MQTFGIVLTIHDVGYHDQDLVTGNFTSLADFVTIYFMINRIIVQ